MGLAKKVTLLAATGLMACLSCATQSQANPASYQSSSAHDESPLVVNNVEYCSNPRGGSGSGSLTGDPIYGSPFKPKFGGSRSANRYFRTGIQHFKENNLSKAERFFKKTLKAEGLDKEAYGFLAIINEKQGDTPQAEKYAEAYFVLKSLPCNLKA